MINGTTLRFVQDGRVVEIDFSRSAIRPSTTVLNYLRSLPHHRGTKEGCAEGDCGACTVLVAELAEAGDPQAVQGLKLQTVNACIQLLPNLHGKALFTVEDLAPLAPFPAPASCTRCSRRWWRATHRNAVSARQAL